MRRWVLLAAAAAAVTLAVAGCGATDSAVTSPPPGTSPVSQAPGAIGPAPTSAVPTPTVTSNPPAAAGTLCSQNGGTSCDGAGTCGTSVATDFDVLRIGDEIGRAHV